MDALLAAEPLIRLSVFAGVFAAMAAWELAAPRRAQEIGRGWRWPSNLGVVVVDTVVLRLFFPTAAVGLALIGEARGWGLFNNLGWPTWIEVVIAVDRARPRHLPPTRPLPRGAGALAAAPHAPRRPGVRRHHGRALPPGRDPPLDAYQTRRRGGLGRSRRVRCSPSRCCSMRRRCSTTATCACRAGSTAVLRWSWSRPKCTASTTPSSGGRRTATSASTCPGGTASSAPIGPSPRRGTKGMMIGIPAFRDPAELRLDRMLLQPLRNAATASSAADRPSR